MSKEIEEIKEDFEKWFNSEVKGSPNFTILERICGFSAWMYQQQKIEQLEKEVEESNKAVVVFAKSLGRERDVTDKLKERVKELEDGICGCCENDRIGSTKLWCCNICGKRQEEF